MHFSTIISTFLAVGAIAAPIINTSRGLPLDTSEATDLLSELESVTGGDKGLPSLPVRGLTVSTDELTGVVTEVEKLAGGAGGLPKRSSIDLSGTLLSVNGLLSNVLGLVNTIKTDLDAILNDAETLDVDGIITIVEGLLKQVLIDVDSITSTEGINLGLTSLQPTLDQLSGELSVISQTVSSLTSKGVAGETVAEVKSLLSQVLSLVNGLSL